MVLAEHPFKRPSSTPLSIQPSTPYAYAKTTLLPPSRLSCSSFPPLLPNTHESNPARDRLEAQNATSTNRPQTFPPANQNAPIKRCAAELCWHLVSDQPEEGVLTAWNS